MKKIAEGEILVHTQKSGRNVDSLRQYLASLRRESEKTSVGLDQLAKSIFMANARGASLGRVIKGLASAAGFGGFGAAAYLAVDRVTRSIVTAQEESDKLTESLNKAIGSKASNTIEGTTQKMQALTAVINETRVAVGKQGMMNAIAAFFFNDDADKAAKAFQRAVEERIALGDKLTAQEAERIAQQQILMDLDGDMAEVFKINLETRKKLSQIEANDALTSQQKLEQSNLAKEERANKLRDLRTKKEKEASKKTADAKKSDDENFARVTLKIYDDLIKQEEKLFEKNAEDFKKAQEERARAAEDASKRILDASKKASQIIQRQDAVANESFNRFQDISQKILMQTAGGRTALASAERQRQNKISKENFRFEEKLLGDEAKRLSGIEGVTLTKQDVRNRMARMFASGTMPSLQETIVGTSQGIEPGQIAQARAEQAMKSGGRGIPQLLQAVERILQQYSSAPLVTSGAGSN